MKEFESVYPVTCEAAKAGVWREIKGISYHLAYYQSTNIKIALAEKQQEYLLEGFNENEASDKANKYVIAHHVIIYWKPFTLRGKKYKHSKENALRLLEEFEGFAEDIMVESVNMENFRQQTLETQKGN